MRIKTLCIAIALFTVTLPVGGCGTDSSRRVALLQTAVGQIEALSETLDAKITQVQVLLAANEKLLSDPNAAGDTLAKLREENARLSAALAAAKPVKALFDDKLALYRAELVKAQAGGPIDPNKEAELYGKGLGAIGGAVGGRARVWLTLAATIVTTFGGAVGGAIARGRKARADLEAVREGAHERLKLTEDEWRRRYDAELDARNEADRAAEGLVTSVDALLASGVDAVTTAKTDAGVTTYVIDPDKAKSILMRAQASTPEAIIAVQRIRAGAQKGKL